MTTPRFRTPRWVLDTNVVLSALIRPGGITGRLRLAWQAKLFTPLISRDTASELIRVLCYPKFRLTAEEQHDLLADYLPWAESIHMPTVSPATLACRDPDDVKFLQLAAIGNAHAIISGDKDLLVLGKVHPITILTPAQAIEMLHPAGH